MRSQASSHPQLRLIQQNPHQLRHGHRRMRVVELNRDFLRKRRPIRVGVTAPEAPDEIAERTGDQKIFLHESQAPAGSRGVVRVEHPGQRFGLQRFGDSADKIAAD